MFSYVPASDINHSNLDLKAYNKKVQCFTLFSFLNWVLTIVSFQLELHSQTHNQNQNQSWNSTDHQDDHTIIWIKTHKREMKKEGVIICHWFFILHILQINTFTRNQFLPFHFLLCLTFGKCSALWLTYQRWCLLTWHIEVQWWRLKSATCAGHTAVVQPWV